MLLNANVAFLAIPGVDPGNYTRTPAQFASYLSIITSLGSIATGLLLLRQYEKPLGVTTEVVSHFIRSLTPYLRSLHTISSPWQDKYLRSHHHNALGFETLAILHSLPYSLLLWA